MPTTATTDSTQLGSGDFDTLTAISQGRRTLDVPERLYRLNLVRYCPAELTPAGWDALADLREVGRSRSARRTKMSTIPRDRDIEACLIEEAAILHGIEEAAIFSKGVRGFVRSTAIQQAAARTWLWNALRDRCCYTLLMCGQVTGHAEITVSRAIKHYRAKHKTR